MSGGNMKLGAMSFSNSYEVAVPIGQYTLKEGVCVISIMFVAAISYRITAIAYGIIPIAVYLQHEIHQAASVVNELSVTKSWIFVMYNSHIK